MLAAGTYTVTVTDNKGCTAMPSQSAVVPQPLQLTVATIPAAQTCLGGPTGAVTTTVAGGTTPYSYWWGSGIVTPDRTNVNAGTYTVTVTDGNGCSATASGTVIGYTPMALNSTQVNNTCYGTSLGAVNLSVANGWTPYTYVWSRGDTTQDISAVAAGSYTVTVNDNHGCSATRTVTITEPSFPITINSTITDVLCSGGATGAISVSVTNGVSPYGYNWGGGIVTQNRSGLIAGNYALTVTDNNACSVSTNFTVNQPLPLAVSYTVTDAPCFGTATGSINLSVTGGFAPFAYSWNGGATTQNRTNVSAGTHSVTVTDNRSCSATASMVVGQPTAISVSATTTNLTCNNINTGAINLAVSGSVSPYSFDWGGGVNTQNRTGLAAGSYTVTVTDNATCTATVTRVITQPSAIAITSANTNVSCNGGNNGAITLSVSGGTGTYSYNWGGGVVSQNRTGLVAGNYMVTVTDANSCTATFSTTITQPTALTASAAATNITCNGAATGSINLTANGGTGAYTYSWSNGPTTSNNNGLNAGTYTVTVRDANLCSATASATIAQPTAITTTITATNITCSGQTNGSIDLQVNGGTGAYTYEWSNGPTTQDISSLAAATYTVTVNDASNCSATASATISQPAVLAISTAAVNVACNGDATGSIDLTVVGGTTGYTYQWSNNATTQDIYNLTAQTYTVTVTDANTCTGTASAVVSQPAALVIAEVHTNLNCNGAGNGTITTTTTGGTGSYNYNWGIGIVTPNRTGLQAGTYTLTVTDNNACTVSKAVTITQPAGTVLTTTQTDVQCNAATTGAIDLTATGGTGVHTYLWSNNALSEDISGVVAGTYSVTVTDGSGCTTTASSTITQPSPITVSFALTNVSCFGGNNGAVSTTISGGNGGYTYVWSNGGTTPTASNLIAGNYNLQIKDVTNCVANLSFNVSQPAQINVSETHTGITCNGANNGAINLTVTGGSPVYTYRWNNNASTPNLSGLNGGVYNVTVTDAGLCTATLGPVNIIQPVGLSLSTVASDVVCSGSGSGAVDLTVTGGTGAYTYHWNNNAITQDVSGVPAGNYLVTVTDANNCTAATSAIVNQSTAMQVSLAKTDVTCYGLANGTLVATIAGGGGNYTYNWSNSATSANLSNLAAATYTVTVHDAQNCTGVATTTITQPAAISIAETHTNVSCNGNANGTITTTANGGVGNYTYRWSNNAGTATISALPAGSYILTVTDASLCSATSAVSITQPASLSLSETHRAYACNTNTGAIDLTVAGGSAPYTYSWTGGLSTQDINNLTAGNYAVTVNDANNCSANTAVAITQIQTLTASVSKTDITCYGGNNGSLSVAVQGGAGPYQYSWSQGAQTPAIANLPAAHYRILVTDANNCTAVDSVTIIQPTAILASTNARDMSCKGINDGRIDVTVTGGTPGYTYHWNTSETGATLTNLIAGNYLLTVTDAMGCSLTGINVPISEPQSLSLASDIIAVACAGHNDGQVTLQVTGGVIPYRYKWNNGVQSQNNLNLASGTYSVTVTDSRGCLIDGDYIIGAAPELTITPTVQNTPCQSLQKGAIDLQVSGGNAGYTFNWNTGSKAEDLNNLAEGSYAVTVTDARNCTAMGNYTVSGSYSLEVNATESTKIDLGETVQLTAVATADHNNTYSWMAANTVACNTCANTETSPMQTTEYLVTVIDENGCKASDMLTIEVNTATDVFIPNAFTPNGDGNNDMFQMFGDLSTIAYLDMMVFNRWGEKVFESNNHNFNWDGTYKGETVPQGVFVYTGKIVFINGTSMQLKGSVTVIR
jgi:gliding motility-associated-like protein